MASPITRVSEVANHPEKYSSAPRRCAGARPCRRRWRCESASGRSGDQVPGRAAVEVELHQLPLRYERLRKRHPRAAAGRSLASLAEIGQQAPVVVVGKSERFELIDGYKRVRASRRLARDMVLVTRWELEEVEALLLERGLRRGSEDALDQAWLMAELQERFGYSLEDLALEFPGFPGDLITIKRSNGRMGNGHTATQSARSTRLRVYQGSPTRIPHRGDVPGP